MSDTIDDRILVRAHSGRWRVTFRVRSDVTPPTGGEAMALAEAIVDALGEALGGLRGAEAEELTRP